MVRLLRLHALFEQNGRLDKRIRTAEKSIETFITCKEVAKEHLSAANRQRWGFD